jgi:hypothetical protein
VKLLRDHFSLLLLLHCLFELPCQHSLASDRLDFVADSLLGLFFCDFSQRSLKLLMLLASSSRAAEK